MLLDNHTDMATPACFCALALWLIKLFQKEQTCRPVHISTHVFDMMRVLPDTVFSMSGR